MDQAWIESYYPRIYRAAWLMTGSAAEASDLAQETFVTALDRWDTFDHRSRPETWMFGILLNLNRRRLRSLARLRRRAREYWDRNDHTTESDPAQLASQAEWRHSIWAEVAKLPRLQRDAVLLRFAEQMTLAEIAAVVKCPLGTAKTRLSHALIKLQNASGLKQLSHDRPMPPSTRKYLATAHPDLGQ
jgi:RNA polymerase sigma-70 factor (ECF subfamily)